MQKKGYALKRDRGLVPHLYTNNESFRDGAHKNWRGVPFRDQGKMAMRETPSANGYVRGHAFVPLYILQGEINQAAERK